MKNFDPEKTSPVKNNLLKETLISNGIKKDFPIFTNNPDLVYLDSASSSQTPKQVIDSITKYYTDFRANIHRGIYDLSQKSTVEYEKARKEIADFIGANLKEIIFTSGATSSSNMLAYMLEQSANLDENDEILISILEHHSSLIPLQELAKRKKLKVKFIPITKDYEIDYEELKNLITEKTKIVSVALVSNVLGTINDIKKIRDMIGKEILLITDATEAVGHIPVNVSALDCDFMFFSGHKMCGPTGIGILYGKKDLLDKFNPSFFGGGMVLDTNEQNSSWKQTPEKFESGTPNIAGAIGLGESTKYLKEIGVENIQKHTQELTKYALEKLGEIKNLKIIAQKNITKNAGVISFTIKRIHSHDIAQILSDNNIAIRAGHHCTMPLIKSLDLAGTARVSFYLYNTKKDVNMLIEALQKTISLFS